MWMAPRAISLEERGDKTHVGKLLIRYISVTNFQSEKRPTLMWMAPREISLEERVTNMSLIKTHTHILESCQTERFW